MIGAVLLAAGESRRMGGIDKRRLTIDGEPLVRRWPRLLAAAGIGEVVVVLGHDAPRIETLVAGTPARTVHNAGWADGQQTSVRAGLAALPVTIDAAMIVLCDLPLIDVDDLRLLCVRFAQRLPGTEAIVPVHRGQRGNPVVVSRAAISVVLADPCRRGLRAFIDAHPEAVQRLEVDNDHYAFDVDTPDDVARLEARLGRPVGIADAR